MLQGKDGAVSHAVAFLPLALGQYREGVVLPPLPPAPTSLIAQKTSMLVDDEIVAYRMSACPQGKSVTFCTVGASFHNKSSYICPPPLPPTTTKSGQTEPTKTLPCNRQSSGCLTLRWNIMHPYPEKSHRLFSLSDLFF